MESLRKTIALMMRTLMPVPAMPPLNLPWGSGLLGFEATLQEAFEIVYYTGAGDGWIIGVISGVLATIILHRLSQRKDGTP